MISGDQIEGSWLPTIGGGAIPTSPLQFIISLTDYRTFKKYNELWHSRLPKIGGFYVRGLFFKAEFNGQIYAVAGWSEPIARMLSKKNYFELRRFAISPGCPKNTATRIMCIMTKIIRKLKPELVKLISYQDTDVHSGTIYKASGWKAAHKSKPNDMNWVVTHKRKISNYQTFASKIRWELDL